MRLILLLFAVSDLPSYNGGWHTHIVKNQHTPPVSVNRRQYHNDAIEAAIIERVDKQPSYGIEEC